MTYQIPQHINKDKIFIVKKSEIKGRLDPHYNQPLYIELWNKLLSIPSKITTLRESSISIFSGITPKSGGEAYTYNQGVPFVRSGDFSETNEIDFSQLLQIKENIHNTFMANSKLKNGDLLIAIVGATIGKVGVYQYSNEANINQAICAVRLKKTLNPYYVQAFLQTNIGKSIIARTKRPVARANINLEEVGNFPIPLLDSHKQHKIVDIMEFGRKQKRAKEVEAQQLLNSIDGYLLKELGITIPNADNELKNRIFFSSFSKIGGNRIDPKYNKQIRHFQELYNTDTWKTLSNVSIVKGQYGANEPAIDFQEGDIRYIRITDIDEIGNLKECEKKTAKHIDDTYLLYNEDILFARSGSVGKCYIHKEENPSIFAGYLIRFVLNKQIILPEFLFYYCNSSLYWYWVDTIHRPAVQSNINAEEYCRMPIPVPSIKKQQEIIDYIADIRTRAKALQTEGKAFLEDAKRKVEQMIMGM